MMAASNIVLKVRFAWWVMPYVNALLFFCRAFRAEPDYKKLSEIIRRGVICGGPR